MKVLELRSAERVLCEVADGPAEWVGTTVNLHLKQEGDYVVVPLKIKNQDLRQPVEFRAPATHAGAEVAPARGA